MFEDIDENTRKISLSVGLELAFPIALRTGVVDDNSPISFTAFSSILLGVTISSSLLSARAKTGGLGMIER